MPDYPTQKEKVAMIRLCIDLATSDGNLTPAKIEGLNRAVSFLQCGQSEADMAQSMNSASAVLILQKMDRIIREMTVDLLRLVAKADGPINSREDYCIKATKVMLNLE